MNKHTEYTDTEDSCTAESCRENNSCLQQLQACQEAVRKAEERYTYLSADFDNYRRRSDRERMRAVQEVRRAIMLDVITLVDNFERAAASLPSDMEATPFHSGFDLIYKAALKLLEEHKVKQLEQMEEFNPEIHEALAHVELPNKKSGTIVEVLEKGYTIGHELLRPARVTVVR